MEQHELFEELADAGAACEICGQPMVAYTVAGFQLWRHRRGDLDRCVEVTRRRWENARKIGVANHE